MLNRKSCMFGKKNAKYEKHRNKNGFNSTRQ